MLTLYRQEPFQVDASYSYPNQIPHPTRHIGMCKVIRILLWFIDFEILFKVRFFGRQNDHFE